MRINVILNAKPHCFRCSFTQGRQGEDREGVSHRGAEDCQQGPQGAGEVVKGVIPILSVLK